MVKQRTHSGPQTHTGGVWDAISGVLDNVLGIAEPILTDMIPIAKEAVDGALSKLPGGSIFEIIANALVDRAADFLGFHPDPNVAAAHAMFAVTSEAAKRNITGTGSGT